MFFPRLDALTLTEAQFRGLRVSLNKPVVVTEEISGGPARAAIAAYVTDGGERKLGVTVVVRALQSQQVVYYDCTEEVANDSELRMMFDAAMSFGEAMGFVFGDDVLAERGLESRKVALQLWREVTGEVLRQEAQSKKRPHSVAEIEHEFGEEDLLLEEDGLEEIVLDSDTEIFATPSVAPSQSAMPLRSESHSDRTEVLAPAALEKSVAPTEKKKPTLSRFRGQDAALDAASACAQTDAQTKNGASDTNDENSRAIGRLKLIKRRGNGVAQASWLCRILRAF